MTIKRKYHGHVIAANPNNPKDKLSKSTILLVTHADNLAIGLQVNNPLVDTDLQSVAHNIGIWWEGSDPLWYGGDNQTNKIHVVHSTDWSGLSTIQINDQIAVTNDISIIAAISRNEGPEFFRACVGYWAWENGEFDKQLAAGPNDNVTHKWELAPANIENIFNREGPDQWRQVLEDSAKYQVANWF